MSGPADPEQLRAARSLAGLVGAPLAVPGPPYVVEVTAEATGRFARSYGDDNPLWADPAYAAGSVRAGVVAPPLFSLATGTPGGDPDPEAARLVAALGRGMLRVGAEAWDLERPMRPGLRLERRDHLHSVELDGDGPVRTVVRSEFVAGGTRYAVHERERIYTGGGHARRGPHREPARYSAEDLAAIDAAYDRDDRRGATPRLGTDVSVGEVIGPMVKGPLTVTDMINYRAGVGPGPLGAESHRLGLANRRRAPHLYDRNVHGVAETRERLHWDAAYAASLGYPSAYDYSHTRPVWLSHLLSDWAGDGGWVASLRTTLVDFSYVGDTHWLAGTVRSVTPAGDRTVVEVELRADNQLGATTCAGVAVVHLPPGPGDAVDLSLRTEEARR